MDLEIFFDFTFNKKKRVLKSFLRWIYIYYTIYNYTINYLHCSHYLFIIYLLSIYQLISTKICKNISEHLFCLLFLWIFGSIVSLTLLDKSKPMDFDKNPNHICVLGLRKKLRGDNTEANNLLLLQLFYILNIEQSQFFHFRRRKKMFFKCNLLENCLSIYWFCNGFKNYFQMWFF